MIIDGKVHRVSGATHVATAHGERLYVASDGTFFVVANSGIRALTSAQVSTWCKGV